MTDDEMKAIVTRLAKATDLRRRIDDLSRAIDHLKRGDDIVRAIAILDGCLDVARKEYEGL